MTTASECLDMSTYVSVCYTRESWKITRTAYRDRMSQTRRVNLPSSWVIV